MQLWFTRVADTTRDAETGVGGLLSVSELERLAHMKSPARQREYRLSRAMMRHALGRQFRRSGADWDIVDRAGSRPEIGNLLSGVFFGLSHSKNLICFALASCPIGVDLEFAAARRNYPALARRFMKPAERDRLARCGDEQQADYFYRVWCAKEAWYKLLPADDQASTPLSAIDYASMTANADRRLYEGRIGDFGFAAVTLGEPRAISCHYYLSSAAELGELDLDGVPVIVESAPGP